MGTLGLIILAQEQGQNLDQVFNSRQGCACVSHGITQLTKLPNLKLKTQPKQLLGCLLLAFVLLV
jgi:hypothetical protein